MSPQCHFNCTRVVGWVSQMVQHFCTRWGTAAKQQTIRAATTKENISTLPLAVSNNQDSRGTGELNEPAVGL